MIISGKTKVCGVIGSPLEHTLSPILHNAAFESLELDYVFLAFKVEASEVENALNGVRALRIQGLNVTMPNKNAVIKYIDELDPTAKTMASVNTILNRNGKLLGFNTDGVGALNSLEQNGVGLKGKKILLLGAGGAARAIAYILSQEADELLILNRTLKPARELADLLKQRFNKKISADELTPRIVKNNVAKVDVLINATSVGMKPNAELSLVESNWLKPNLVVMDIVYDPIETKLAKDAKMAGAKVVSGVEMLIYQAAASFEIWTACKAPIEVMRKAALSEILKVQDID